MVPFLFKSLDIYFFRWFSIYTSFSPFFPLHLYVLTRPTSHSCPLHLTTNHKTSGFCFHSTTNVVSTIQLCKFHLNVTKKIINKPMFTKLIKLGKTTKQSCKPALHSSVEGLLWCYYLAPLQDHSSANYCLSK
jgi:hypothetical protein